MSTPSNPKSIFPDLPREVPAVNAEGNFNYLWSLGFSSLFQALQVNFKNEGIMFPPLDATEIAQIEGLYTPFIGSPLPDNLPDISGQTVFDSTNRVSKQFVITYSGSNIATAQWRTFAFV